MSARILGRGVRFPFRPGADGRFAFVDDEAVVAQSIELILSTAIGERQMRFAFGSELPNLIFEPTSSATLARVEVAAREALRDFEKRIVVRSARAERDPDVASRVILTIDYEIPRTSRRGNLVFPFYLQGG
jgi:hypothetical protein